MKQITFIFLLLLSLAAKAQEGADKPNFYSVTFNDNKTYWAEDITPAINNILTIKTLLFKHSQVVYVIDIANGIVVESNGGYKKGTTVKSIHLYKQESSPIGGAGFYNFETGRDIIIKFGDGINYIGKITKSLGTNPIYDVQFYHSNSNYSFRATQITKSGGKYKVGENVLAISYCIKTNVYTTKRAIKWGV